MLRDERAARLARELHARVWRRGRAAVGKKSAPELPAARPVSALGDDSAGFGEVPPARRRPPFSVVGGFAAGATATNRAALAVSPMPHRCRNDDAAGSGGSLYGAVSVNDFTVTEPPVAVVAKLKMP